MSQKVVVSVDGLSTNNWNEVRLECGLSSNELVILKWLADGWPVGSITLRLGAKKQAVKNRIKSALAKIKKHGDVFSQFGFIGNVWEFAKKAAA